MMSAKPGETFHISSDDFITIREWLKKLSEELTRILMRLLSWARASGKDEAYLLSSENSNKFNWQPQVSLDEGIDQVFSG